MAPRQCTGHALLVLLALLANPADGAFQSGRTNYHESSCRSAIASSSQIFAEKKNSFFQDLPNLLKGPASPFGSTGGSDEIPLPTEFTPTPEGLIFQAKRVLAADLGLLDPSLLDDATFSWIDSNNVGTESVALSKTEYVAAGRFFNLRGAFPDFDYRAHDFRVDEDGETVRFTTRTKGTMRGELRLRSGILPPTGNTMKCPPEAVSLKFNLQTGKVTKLCTGFCLDRQVGNTKGTTGTVAASIIAGQRFNEWDLYPPTTVFRRVFAGSLKPIEEGERFVAPFPEQVMIQLAKGVLVSDMGADDPSLLSDTDFTFLTPTVGPIGKREFLEKYAVQEFANIEDPQFSGFRIDPYDPVRVWADLKPVAPGFEGPPQAMSLSFDDDGFCTRITSWAVMDPSVGNAGGLGGPEGYKYATGKASLGLTSRPLPQLFGRIRKRALSPLTGIGVDEYIPLGLAKKEKKAPKAVSSPPPPKPAPVEKEEPPVEKAPVAEKETLASRAEEEREAAAQEVMKRLESIKEMGASIKIKPPSIPSIQIQPPNKADNEKKNVEQLPQRENAAKELAAKKAELVRKRQEVAEERARMAEERRQQAEIAKAEAARKREAAAEDRRRQAEAKKAEAEERRRQAEAERQQKAQAKLTQVKAKVATKPTPTPEEDADKKEREKLALDTLAKAATRATISLFGLGGRKDDVDDDGSSSVPISVPKTTKKAPPGVPTLSRWRRNRDNSITGLVKGSKGFQDGDRITTSPIQTGTLAPGEVVRTGSGSRYFLE